MTRPKRAPRLTVALLLASVLGVAACGPPGAGAPPGPSAAPAVAPGAAALAATTDRLVLAPGESQFLAPLLREADGRQPVGGVSYGTSNPAVANVDASGQVTGKAPGEATVTALHQATQATATIRIVVSAAGAVTRVLITPAGATLKPGEQVKLGVQIATAEGAVTGTAAWSSSDDTVVKVDPTTGLATALREGRATIVAAPPGGGDVRGLADLVVTGGAVAAVPTPAPSGVVFGPDAGATPRPPAAVAFRRVELHDATGSLVGFGARALSLLDASTGFLAAGGPDGKERLLKTMDGGATWALAGAPDGLKPAVAMAFASQQQGAVASAAAIHGTADGGATWREWPWPAGARRFAQVSLQGAEAAVVVAQTLVAPYPTAAWQTSDAGASWQELATPTLSSGASVVVQGGTTWLVDGASVSRFRPGAGWEPHVLGGPGARVLGVTLVTPVVGYARVAVAAGFAVYRTADGGGSWVKLRSTDKRNGGTIAGLSGSPAFLDENTGIAVGGAVSLTRDAGASWDVFPGPPSNMTRVVVYPTAERAWAVLDDALYHVDVM